MLSVNILYSTKEKFLKSLLDCGFGVEDKCLVRIYTAICNRTEAVEIAREVKGTLPNSQLIGASASGVILDGKQYDEHTLVVVERFDFTNILINHTSYRDRNADEVANDIKKFVEGSVVETIHTLCGNKYPDIHNFIEAFNTTHSHIKLVGGIVGDVLPTGDEGYVFTEEGVFEHSILTAALCGEKLNSFNYAILNHDPISPIYTLGECDGSIIRTIENMSAVKWSEEQFGLDKLTDYEYDWEVIAENDALIRFQIILEGHGGASRFIRYDAEQGEMSLYFSQLNNNTKFRIGYTSPTKCIEQCYELCDEIAKVPVESIFVYDCLFRKLYLGNCAEWEIRPFADCNIAGAFMMGEIAYINGRNEFLNGACSMIAVAEKEKYISPNLNVFDSLEDVQDDNEKLLSFVLQKQSVAMNKENKELLEKLMQQQERNKEQLYIDANTGMNNSIKYSIDIQSKHYDKMCMIQIDNAQLLINRLGQRHYYKVMCRAVEEIIGYTNYIGLENKLSYYILNDSTIFIVATRDMGEKLFLNIVKDLYENYQFINVGTKDELLINRFVVIKSNNNSNMLERGIATLQNSKNLQTHFIVCNDTIHGGMSLSSEMDMLYILNQAVATRKIIPYFQAIHDNLHNKTVKYEALMRLEDDDGRIYAPGEFMDIAKKYHLYSSISKIMIEKVIDIFGGTDKIVSINLSVYDINYYPMREFIFEKLDIIKDGSNFIFEILEDENFKDMESLKSFIDQARTYGVKIAIDDFGNGYSNFMEIARIEPDYIKVDASIIKNVDTNGASQKVLENIAFLGKQLGAELVAEFVDRESIQDKLVVLNIRYSQGYYFAKPKPYEEIENI